MDEKNSTCLEVTNRRLKMSNNIELDRACDKLKELLNNPYAVARLEKELSPHWEHPGWKDFKDKKKVVRK